MVFAPKAAVYGISLSNDIATVGLSQDTLWVLRNAEGFEIKSSLSDLDYLCSLKVLQPIAEGSLIPNLSKACCSTFDLLPYSTCMW